MENEKWWRIMESSHRVVKFISIDVKVMVWLVTLVRDYTASMGSSEFLRTRRKGAGGAEVSQ